jgi:hypothetical protein
VFVGGIGRIFGGNCEYVKGALEALSTDVLELDLMVEKSFESLLPDAIRFKSLKS